MQATVGTISADKYEDQTATDLPVTFSNGQASVSVKYKDVGQIALNVKDVSTPVDTTGLPNGIRGGSTPFVVKPAGFVLSDIVRSADNFANPEAQNADGAAFIHAGATFSVTVTAVDASGDATPSYGQETPAQTVKLSSTLVAPADKHNPNLQGQFNPFGIACDGTSPASPGTACGDFSWGEVGIITLTPSVDDYLGAGKVTGTTSDNIGRFIPARFTLSANTPSFADACTGGVFTYLSQEFPFAVDPVIYVTAVNTSDQATENYGGDFWKLDTGLAQRSYANEVSGTTSVLSRTTSGGDAALEGNDTYDGKGTYIISGDRLTYSKPTTPIAPFDAKVDLDLAKTDLTDSDGVCYDPDNDGSCDSYTVSAIAGAHERWGRLVLQNGYGPELLDLQVPMHTEYYGASGFQTNTDDTCTGSLTMSLADPDTSDGLQPASTCVRDTGSPGNSGMGCSTTSPTGEQFNEPPVAGDFNLWFKAPGAGRTGSLNLTVQVPAWLQYDWQGTGDTDPTARLTFGIFKSDSHLIYTRELY